MSLVIKPMLAHSSILKFLVFSVLVALMSFSYAEMTNPSKPRFVAVFFEADWCSSCKALAPKLSQAREQAQVDDQDILFISLDLTNEHSSHQAGLLAASLGLQALYENNNGKTGYIAIVEASSGMLISKLTKHNSVAEITTAIDISG